MLLCAGTSLAVVERDGAMDSRGRPDVPVPYAPENSQVLLHSARFEHDMTPVLGPELADGDDFPERRPDGTAAYRLGPPAVPPSAAAAAVRMASGAGRTARRSTRTSHGLEAIRQILSCLPLVLRHFALARIAISELIRDSAQ